MKNLLKEVRGNIYGLGVYCFKDAKGNVLYVGSGMMNDRLQTHLYSLKRGLYEGTNKDILQKVYNCKNLTFEVLHFSENNSTYLNGSDAERQQIQEALETLEQFYLDMYKDSVCNLFKKVTKFSTSPNRFTTYKRRVANLGERNPNVKYSEEAIANILWLKMNGYKNREIAEYYKDVNKNYIPLIGITKWINTDPIKPDFIKY